MNLIGIMDLGISGFIWEKFGFEKGMMKEGWEICCLSQSTIMIGCHINEYRKPPEGEVLQ